LLLIYVLGYFNDLWKMITYDCFGVNSLDHRVCSGRGNCIDDNVCECTGAIGTQCETLLCFDIPENNSNVCSGNGNCIAHNVCDCNLGWTGSDCSEIIHHCHGKNADNPSVCSSRGTC